MLVLSRRLNEQIMIGDDIVIEVVRICPGQVRLGIMAPPEVKVLRTELITRDKEAKARHALGRSGLVRRPPSPKGPTGSSDTA